MKYLVLFLVLIGFVGTTFADNTLDYSDALPGHDCSFPICLLDDDNLEEPSQGSDFVIKVQVEPETRFTVWIFDPDYNLTFNESTLSDEYGIATIVYLIPQDAQDGHYELKMTTYASKGASHHGGLIRIGERFPPQNDEPPKIIHIHMEHDDFHYNPLVVDKQINMRIITNYKFENYTSLPLEFTIYGPDGIILEEGTITNTANKTARHYFMAETDGLHTAVAKSDARGLSTFSEKFGVLKSQYIIHENEREYPIAVTLRDEPRIAIHEMTFEKNSKKITFDIEPTWGILDDIIGVELPYGLMGGPYQVFVDGQLQNMESNSGHSAGIFLRGDLTVLAIPLEYNSSKVEIVGTTVFPKTSEELTVNTKRLEYNADETLTIHGTSTPEENLTVNVYKSDGIIAFSDEFVSGPHGTFEHDVFAWPKHSIDFLDGRYTVEVSNRENLERLDTIEVKFQNRYDFFSGFQQIPISHQLKSFEFLPTKIACKENLILVVKEHNDSPACVFPTTAAKLSQRGSWNVIEHNISINWLDSDYTVNGTGIVQVVDSRMNMSIETVESLTVYMWSDSDPDGIELRLTETGPNTDTFEGIVYFSETIESSEGKLFVSVGDLVQIFHKNLIDTILLS